MTPIRGLGKCDQCEEDAIGFSDEGVALCEDCLFEEALGKMAYELRDRDDQE